MWAQVLGLGGGVTLDTVDIWHVITGSVKENENDEGTKTFTDFTEFREDWTKKEEINIYNSSFI